MSITEKKQNKRYALERETAQFLYELSYMGTHQSLLSNIDEMVDCLISTSFTEDEDFRHRLLEVKNFARIFEKHFKKFSPEQLRQPLNSHRHE